MAHSRPRIEAALSITLCHLGYQHLHSTRYRSSSRFHMTMQQVTNLSKECTLVYLVVQIAICNAVQHLSQQTSWFCSGRVIRSGRQREVQQTSHIECAHGWSVLYSYLAWKLPRQSWTHTGKMDAIVDQLCLGNFHTLIETLFWAASSVLVSLWVSCTDIAFAKALTLKIKSS